MAALQTQCLVAGAKSESLLNIIFDKHIQLGHVGMDVVFRILNYTDVALLAQARLLCVDCLMGKSSRGKQGGIKIAKAHRANFRWFMDTCGPFQSSFYYGYRYYLVGIDEFTDYSVVMFMKHKSEFEGVAKFLIGNANARHTPNVIAELRIDGAGEFNSNALSTWYKDTFLLQLTGLPYAHEHQWKAERVLRHIQELERAMRSYAATPPDLWNFSTQQANEVRCLVPTSYSKLKHPQKSGGRPVVPLELFMNTSTRNNTMKELHKHLIAHGEEVVFHVYKETRRKGKGDMAGKRAIYLSSNGPTRVHNVLVTKTRKLITNVRTVRRTGRFPLREAREADMNTIYDNLSFKGEDDSIDSPTLGSEEEIYRFCAQF